MAHRVILVSCSLLEELLKGGGMPAISNAPKDLRVVREFPSRDPIDGKIGLICESQEWAETEFLTFFEPIFGRKP